MCLNKGLFCGFFAALAITLVGCNQSTTQPMGQNDNPPEVLVQTIVYQGISEQVTLVGSPDGDYSYDESTVSERIKRVLCSDGLSTIVDPYNPNKLYITDSDLEYEATLSKIVSEAKMAEESRAKMAAPFWVILHTAIDLEGNTTQVTTSNPRLNYGNQYSSIMWAGKPGTSFTCYNWNDYKSDKITFTSSITGGYQYAYDLRQYKRGWFGNWNDEIQSIRFN